MKAFSSFVQAALIYCFVLSLTALASEATPGDETHALAGIGVVAVGDGAGSMLRDHILIKKVIAKGPADKAGLLAGDEIVKIDDTPVAGMSLHNAVQNHLRGPLGSVVKVTVMRAGAGRMTVDIVRDVVPVR
jgi:C-terminal processing protease CtpA/Prc